MKLDNMLRLASIILFIILLIFISFISVKIFFWDTLYEEREESTRIHPIEKVESEATPLAPKEIITPIVTPPVDSEAKSKPFTVLLLGVDTKNLKGRSDTIILATVNPGTNKISLLSIPRDTRVKIHGKGYEKIAHANAYSLNTAIYTVEDLLKVKVDYYANINLNGFTDLVDAIGGLNIDVEKNISFNDRLTNQTFKLNAGQQKLNGIQTLNYARFRSDGEGDFGRIRRQQQVLSEIANQTTDVRNLKSITKIVSALGNNIKTDIDFTKTLKTIVSFSDLNGNDIEKIELKATSQMMEGLSYVIITDEELQRIRNEISKKLKGN